VGVWRRPGLPVTGDTLEGLVGPPPPRNTSLFKPCAANRRRPWPVCYPLRPSPSAASPCLRRRSRAQRAATGPQRRPARREASWAMRTPTWRSSRRGAASRTATPSLGGEAVKCQASNCTDS
jgi:hypothetical protein